MSLTSLLRLSQLPPTSKPPTMFHGAYDDDDDDAFNQLGPFGTHMPTLLNPNRNFVETYRCFSVAMMQGNERENVNFGGKIILPQSALVKLGMMLLPSPHARQSYSSPKYADPILSRFYCASMLYITASLNIEYPMLFKLENLEKDLHTHAGVLEFIAEEGRCYLPHWMMQTLLLEPGEIIEIRNTTLPLGTFVKIEPQSVDFLDITNPKAVLEQALRNFSTLTRGDIIQINYNSKVYEIRVLEIRPEMLHGGLSIVETDLEVDFAPPVGYVEPPRSKQQPKLDGPRMATEMAISQQVQQQKTSFAGVGVRLNGKPLSAGNESAQSTSEPTKPVEDEDGVPAALNLPFGQLFFGYPIVPFKPKDGNEEEAAGAISAQRTFVGQGQTLRPRRNPTSATASRTASPTPGSPALAPSPSPRVTGGDVDPFKGKVRLVYQ
ncbi:putative ubiquitin fusion degradation protein Ufd1 [Jimgerdemannia flammicorona]|uniref:Putative ubiquitin fusion degradation protein Ufd1 n=1 Tax=Jimgerdemannia flammicorona TaxID=994334 RepID=A0A433R0S4_9FUNG|nr:putative ubiquitin fusion degradation protein Ufd1 [Jimgerdemannia flammicorona]